MTDNELLELYKKGYREGFEDMKLSLSDVLKIVIAA